MKYALERTCKECNHVDSFMHSKVEAAFELYNASEIWKRPCSNCGSVNCKLLSNSRPELDLELLDMWGNDLDLFFMQQDQEILLAEYENLSMLLAAIDESKYHETKINILVEAVCVLLYDHTIAPDEYSEEENENRKKIAEHIIIELKKRKKKVEKASGFIMDYIKDEVFHQIGLKNK